MKRLLIATGFLMALALPASVAAAPPAWNLTGTYKVTFTCTAGCADTYIHSMTITTSDDTTGAVTGSGSVDGYSGYDWTVTGTVSGSDVTLDIKWISPPDTLDWNPLLLTGTIDASGGMSGTATDNVPRSFTWATTEGAAAPVATPTPTPTATPSQEVGGVTATIRTNTAPPTSTGGGSTSDGSAPLFALLICLAFGGLGLTAVEAQRRGIRS